MKQTLRIYYAMSNRKSILCSYLKGNGWISNDSTTISAKRSFFLVYKPSKEIVNKGKRKRSLHFMYNLLTLLLLFITSLASAQDVLVGLTSNGGPEGKGTAYSIKTNGAGFSVMKAFADCGTNPVSDLVKGTDGKSLWVGYQWWNLWSWNYF